MVRSVIGRRFLAVHDDALGAGDIDGRMSARCIENKWVSWERVATWTVPTWRVAGRLASSLAAVDADVTAGDLKSVRRESRQERGGRNILEE